MSDEQQPGGTAHPGAGTPAAARPTGKRQLSGATTTSSDAYAGKRAARVEKKEEDSHTGGGVSAFPGEVATEMRKVIWPTTREMVQYMVVTFIFLVILTVLVWGVDALMGLGVEAVLTP